LRVLINHFYGSEEQFDIQLVKLVLDLEGSREVEAIEHGWAINDEKWYNCRSTRISLDSYDKPKKVSGYTFTYHKDLTAEELEQVDEAYQAFLDYKGFKKIYNLQPQNPRTSWLLCKSDKVHAFTMFTEYDGALESNLTAWDYSEMKKSIGRHIIGYEVEIARQMGLDHLYIGPGYGKSAIYKAYLRGFQWWTGMEWSDDIDKYTSLCERDDTVLTIEELSRLYEDTPGSVGEGT
jgi:hypothetical protein